MIALAIFGAFMLGATVVAVPLVRALRQYAIELDQAEQRLGELNVYAKGLEAARCPRCGSSVSATAWPTPRGPTPSPAA